MLPPRRQNSAENSNSGPRGRALPELARKYLSRPGYALLEACRALAPGTSGDTSYELLRRATGLRSGATLVKALKELDLLGVIDYRVRRDSGGHVAGLWMQYRGIPEMPSRNSLDAYRRQLESELVKGEEHLEHVHEELKELEAEITRVAKSGAAKPAGS